jgi:hypothetical protein
MQVSSPIAPLRLSLERSRIVSLVEPTADLVAACDSGLVWITVEGRPRDVILRPGETAALPARRLIVVQALEATVLELSAS